MHVKKIGGQEFTESVLVVMLMLQNHGCFEPLCLDFPNALQCGGTNSDAYCSLAFFIEHPQRNLLKKLVISVLFIDSLGEECERWSPPIPHQNFKAPLTCSSPESILCCRSREAILSSFPSPLQHLTSLQSPVLLPQSLASRIHTSLFKLLSLDIIQEDLTLPCLLPLNLFTKPIPSRYSENKDSAIARNHPHYVCMNKNWHDFSKKII